MMHKQAQQKICLSIVVSVVIICVVEPISEHAMNKVLRTRNTHDGTIQSTSVMCRLEF